MGYDATSGISPSPYKAFCPLSYPSLEPLTELPAFPIIEDDLCSSASESIIGTPSSQSSLGLSGMFDIDSFFNYQFNDWSTASSSSQLSTPPLSCSGSDTVTEAEMFSLPFDQSPTLSSTAIFPLDFPDSLPGSTQDVDWSPVLSALRDGDPEIMRWFIETYQASNQTQTSVHDDDVLMQTGSAPKPPSPQLSDTLLHEPALSTFVAPWSNHSKDPSILPPLHQPQPVRPIPPIPIKDLAAAAVAALRHSKPRGPRDALSPLSLLCQPVTNDVRRPRKPTS